MRCAPAGEMERAEASRSQARIPPARRPWGVRACEANVSDPEAEEPPQKGDGATKAANKERLATALRENLRRRRAQRGARKATKADSMAAPAAGSDTNSVENSGPEK